MLYFHFFRFLKSRRRGSISATAPRFARIFEAAAITFSYFVIGASPCKLVCQPNCFASAISLFSRTVTFPLSEENVSVVFEAIERFRKDNTGKYHFTKNNCTSFLEYICFLIDLPITSGQTNLKAYDGFITRIKMYAISSMIAKCIKDSDLIYTIKGLASLADGFNRLPLVMKRSVEQFSLSDCFQSFYVNENLKTKIAFGALYHLCKAVTKNYQIEQISDLFPTNSLPSPQEIDELCTAIIKGSQRQLTHQIYNLFERLYLQHGEYEIHTPDSLYKNLARLSKAKLS